MTKKCVTCKKKKTLACFPKWRAVCKKCVKIERAAKHKQIYAKDRENLLKIKKLEYQVNKQQILLKNKLWRTNNPQKTRKYCSIYMKKYPERKNARTAKRRAAKLQRIPKWLTKSEWIEIKWAYALAKQITKETGISHVVDHIIPLQGENISGLHCPQNLQIISAKENNQKQNKFPYIKG
jgi:hypothetical protein